MATKKLFLQYREELAAGGIPIDGVTISDAGVCGVYETAAEVPTQLDDVRSYVTIEYDYDESAEIFQNLVLNATKDGFDKKWPGKTREEQIQLDQLAMEINRARETQGLRSKQINKFASVAIERLEGWKMSRAQQQDALAGNNTKTMALYQEIEDIRVKSNEEQAKIAALDPSTAEGRAAIKGYNPNFISEPEVPGI